MDKQLATETYDNQLVILHSPSWGSYVARCRVVTGRGPWRAEGEVLFPVRLPSNGGLPFAPGKPLSVGGVNVSEWGPPEVRGWHGEVARLFLAEAKLLARHVGMIAEAWQGCKTLLNATQIARVQFGNPRTPRTDLQNSYDHHARNLTTWATDARSRKRQAEKTAEKFGVDLSDSLALLNVTLQAVETLQADMAQTMLAHRDALKAQTEAQTEAR